MFIPCAYHWPEPLQGSDCTRKIVCSKEAKRKCTLHDHWCFWELNKVIFKNAGSLELLIASVWGRASRIKNRIESHMWKRGLAPVTPKSDQVQNSPAASPVMLHYTVSRTWLFTPRRLRGGSWGEKNWDGRRNEGGEGGETGEGRKTDLCFPARFLPFPSPAAVVSPSLSLRFPIRPTICPWVSENRLLIPYSDKKWLYYQFSLPHLHIYL